MIFQQIEHNLALDWIRENKNLKGTIHENFDEWYKHLSYPNKLSYFKNYDHHWSAAIDENIIGIYYYTIYQKKMYDGYLVTSRPYVGIKLDKYQKEYTKNLYKWKINWTMCNKKYLKYNLRLGYKIASKEYNNYYYLYRK